MKLAILLCGAIVTFASSAVDAHPVVAPVPPLPPVPPMPAAPPPPPALPQIVIPLEVLEACKGKADGAVIAMAIEDGHISGTCKKAGKGMGFALESYTVHRTKK